MSPTPAWSDDRIVTLSKLWSDGLSASQIAHALGGVTRNAVIGKVHRLGLTGRDGPSAPRQASAPPTPPRRRPARAARSFKAASPTVAAHPIEKTERPGLVTNIACLGARACRWPIGDPKDSDFSFCGRPADGRYCDTHERRGTRPGIRWRADRDPVVRQALAGLI